MNDYKGCNDYQEALWLTIISFMAMFFCYYCVKNYSKIIRANIKYFKIILPIKYTYPSKHNKCLNLIKLQR